MPTFIDLFAGCGGFSLGLQAAGFSSLVKVELDGWACDTLRKNFPTSHVIEADIRSLSDESIRALGPVDVIVGGPPCQGFSVAGSTQFGIEDPRNELFRWFLRWIEILRPQAAVIENVPNILSRTSNGQTIADVVQDILGPIGYQVSSNLLNAVDFGVPQSRRRAFIVALRGAKPFAFPQATHGDSDNKMSIFGLKKSVTVGDAFSDLPKIEAGEGTDDPVPYGTDANSAYQVICRNGSNLVTNHVAMKHTARLIERFKIIAPGQSLKDVPESHTQIAYHTGKKSDKPFKYNNYRLNSEKPSLAIPASFQSLFLHPEFDRNLTAREAARLMGFPDSFVFMGKRTTMSWEKNLSQYNQIGNAVCPPVAEALGVALAKRIDTNRPGFGDNVVVISSALKSALKPPSALQRMVKGLPDHVHTQLNIVARQFGQAEDCFSYRGVNIPSAALSLAVILAQAKNCPICAPDLAPNACHDGAMCFLISKDDNESLLKNSHDHGLDFHLRTSLNVTQQIGHYVGERLGELEIVDLCYLQNPRTGRNVRGMRVRNSVQIDSAITGLVLEAIRACYDPASSIEALATGSSKLS